MRNLPLLADILQTKQSNYTKKTVKFALYGDETPTHPQESSTRSLGSLESLLKDVPMSIIEERRVASKNPVAYRRNLKSLVGIELTKNLNRKAANP